MLGNRARVETAGIRYLLKFAAHTNSRASRRIRIRPTRAITDGARHHPNQELGRASQRLRGPGFLSPPVEHSREFLPLR